jgi:hypothetical protein
VLAPTEINVYQQAGESGEAFAERVAQKVVDRHWNAKMSDAKAGR